MLNKAVPATKLNTRIRTVKGLTKGLQRVHSKVVQEHKEMVKELVEYHKDMLLVVVKETNTGKN